MTTQTRQQEIKQIWKDHQGLYVVAGVFIGLFLFPLLEMVITDLSQLMIGLVPEAIGIGFTVIFLDRIYQKREIENLKKRLIREAGSQSNETAKAAVAWLNHEKWLIGENGLLKGASLMSANLKEIDLIDANLSGADLQHANLEGATLWGANLKGADLSYANLSGAKLEEANLEGAELDGVKLSGAELQSSNLKEAGLSYANLSGADLKHANLSGADLQHANLKGADLSVANLIGALIDEKTLFDEITQLPDSNISVEEGNEYSTYQAFWTPDIDMSRYTNPDHLDFWDARNIIIRWVAPSD